MPCTMTWQQEHFPSLWYRSHVIIKFLCKSPYILHPSGPDPQDQWRVPPTRGSLWQWQCKPALSSRPLPFKHKIPFSSVKLILTDVIYVPKIVFSHWKLNKRRRSGLWTWRAYKQLLYNICLNQTIQSTVGGGHWNSERILTRHEALGVTSWRRWHISWYS